jgi:hypothetical protein
MQLLKKSNMVDYRCMYSGINYHVEDPFQLICNYNTTNYFFDVAIYLLIPCISRGIIT